MKETFPTLAEAMAEAFNVYRAAAEAQLAAAIAGDQALTEATGDKCDAAEAAYDAAYAAYEAEWARAGAGYPTAADVMAAR